MSYEIPNDTRIQRSRLMGSESLTVNNVPPPSTSEHSTGSKWNKFLANGGSILVATALALSILWTLYISITYISTTSEQRYMNMRTDLLSRHRHIRVGGKLRLTLLEEIANGQLLMMKAAETSLEPTLYKKRNKDLFEALKSLPKGGLLHVHDVGMFNTEDLIDLTHQQDVWACVSDLGEFEELRFSQLKPKNDSQVVKCNWQPMSNYWEHENSTYYLKKLRGSLSIVSGCHEGSLSSSKHMKRATRLIYGLVSFYPNWSSLMFRMLQEIHADGVQYIEMRSSLPILYDFNSTSYTIWHTANSLAMTKNLFTSIYHDFIGFKLIYAPLRSDKDVDIHIMNARFLKAEFPRLFVGFDLLSFGSKCKVPSSPSLSTLPSLPFSPLLHISKEIDFYFHIGDSDCLNTIDGGGGDINIIDAMLLGSKRLANAANLFEYPELMRSINVMKVAVEVLPLSDYYLQEMHNFRTHPAVYLIASGFPIVIGSDYPSFWGATPLTDDFYVAFVGLSSGQGDLHLLKQLAINSIVYSGLDSIEKEIAISKWLLKWDDWISDFLRGLDLRSIRK